MCGDTRVQACKEIRVTAMNLACGPVSKGGYVFCMLSNSQGVSTQETYLVFPRVQVNI